MALASEFDRELHKLFKRRIAWLRHAIGKKRPGPAPAFSASKVKPLLEGLGTTARQLLLRQRGKREFEASFVSKRQWHVRNKGWGWRAKKDAFRGCTTVRFRATIVSMFSGLVGNVNT